MRQNYKNYVGKKSGAYIVTEDNGDILKISCVACNSSRDIKRWSHKFPSYCPVCESEKIKNKIPIDLTSLNLNHFQNCTVIKEDDATQTCSLTNKRIIIKCNCCKKEDSIRYTSFLNRKTDYICETIKIKRKKLSRVRKGIVKRCYNTNNRLYKRYGKRGIKMCDEWRNVPGAFIEWALNNKYEMHLQLDRINNDGNYTPDNCRFVTCAENSRNRSTNSLTKELVIKLKNTDWGHKNYREITESIGLDGIKNVAGVWAVLNNKTWKEIK